MPNTYTQLYVQLVFAVHNRTCLIREDIRENIQKYISAIIQRDKCKLYAIYCNPDHTHILIGIHPTISISELARDIKSVSSKFINSQLRYAFKWQDGFGAFSYSQSHVNQVIAYINNQPIHHKKRSFREEYIDFLKKYEVDYDERYLFFGI